MITEEIFISQDNHAFINFILPLCLDMQKEEEEEEEEEKVRVLRKIPI
jgi:hypothetical protein